MTKRDHTPAGAPCWIDLFSSDTDAARRFYGELFGWSAEEPNAELGGYFNFQKDGERIAGAMKNDGSSPAPDSWSLYFAVEDGKETEKAASANGGQIYMPAHPVEDLGSMVLMADPSGAAVGGWQSGTHTGFHETAEPNTPAWFELHTSEYEKAIEFYRQVFGADTTVMSDEADFRYTNLMVGGEEVAGIMDAAAMLPEGAASHWSIYFACDDTDKAVEQVVTLGGSLITPAADSPYGRLAEVGDPTGATFRLVSS